MAVIIEYEDQYLQDFQRLNLEWLEKFDLVESHDLEILNHPREIVIDRGGFIFLLKDNDAVVGSAGIFKMPGLPIMESLSFNRYIKPPRSITFSRG